MNICPICGAEKKKLIRYWEKGHSIRHDRKKVEAWDYKLNTGEELITGFCEGCKTKFLSEEEMR